MNIDDRLRKISEQYGTVLKSLLDTRDILDETREYLIAKDRRITRELLQHRVDAVDMPEAPQRVDSPKDSPYTNHETRETAVQTAVDEWRRGVMEPPGSHWERIDSYIRGPLGLGWSSADANHLDKPIAYKRNRQFAWCGAFCAWCWGHAGLKASIRRKDLASLYRLYRFAHGTERYIEPEAVKIGDVVSMGEVDGPKHGQHMALAVRNYQNGTVVCIEGNAYGEDPHGDRYEGVVQNVRPVMGHGSKEPYQVRYGVRFLESDLEKGETS